jgi:hypothetical protein
VSSISRSHKCLLCGPAEDKRRAIGRAYFKVARLDYVVVLSVDGVHDGPPAVQFEADLLEVSLRD